MALNGARDVLVCVHDTAAGHAHVGMRERAASGMEGARGRRKTEDKRWREKARPQQSRGRAYLLVARVSMGRR